jgi:homopolymeric O-antigen transport system ATP-binding protein
VSKIIEVSGLSKSYTISHERKEAYTALRDVMVQKAKKLFSFPAGKSKTIVTTEEFWALKDISFSVEGGDRLGIIGRNGAGKSTLLKILSRITEPTLGSIKIKGRVASLLEVGTGFHPELTGRENIFLNGAILGMSRAEIRKHFDAIVNFAEIEKFLDTPVKRYSSGMYVRLAFSVAAHLEPEILIIDEVLAVGDAQFQKKCLGKMEDVSNREGRTVLFVSHNMPAVKSICTKGILLVEGEIARAGNVDIAVSDYLKGGSFLTNHKLINNISVEGVTVNEIRLNAVGKSPEDPISINSPTELITSLYVAGSHDRYRITYHIYNESGEPIFSCWDEKDEAVLQNGINHLKCVFPAPFFNTGTFYVSLFIVKNKKEAIFVEKDIISFTVSDDEKPLGHWMGREPGFIRPMFKWTNN